MNREKVIQGLERLLLIAFNQQQEIEGFTTSEDSEEIYQAESANDGLFRVWVSDCNLREARLYRDMRGVFNEPERP